jgi:hypothetical protein
MDRADKLMTKVDDSFQRMSRGGVINTTTGMQGLLGNLRSANSIFKKLDKLTKAGADTYTEEEKKAIEAKAKELTSRYNTYYSLIDQANKIAEGMVKTPVNAAADAMKSIAKDAAAAVKGAIGLEKKDDTSTNYEGTEKEEEDQKEGS